jgi:ABC-type Fe3+/spermidine/putrescine transport system ATPase subunit
VAEVTSALSVVDVRKTFGRDVRAVDGLSLDVAAGEIVAVVGPSGCGKTTLLRLIAGFEQLDGGAITLDDRLLDDGRHSVSAEKRGIGFVFQDYALFPHLTVEANVAFGLARLPKAAAGERVSAVLELCDIRELGARYPHELSGGQQQRVALARALAPGNRLLLLDEPMSNLDADTRRSLRARLRDLLRQAGVTALLVTHDCDDAFVLGDRVAVLREGRLEQVGSPREIYAQPASVFVAGLVGEVSVLAVRAADGVALTAAGPVAGVVPASGDAVAVFRPDELVIAVSGTPAEVIDATFRDGRWLVVVRLEGGEVVKALTDTCPRVGDRVAVTARGGWLCRGR